jgi:digeranylgeranylglycerophospholipid reductase
MQILIVGAGPVGCYTAQLLTKMGYKPVLLEEHSSVGKPVQCAGIVSTKLISMIKPFVPSEAIINHINSFSINSPWVEKFSINIPGIACIVNREMFDLKMGKNLDIHLDKRVICIEKKDNRYYVHTEQGKTFKADILIGADGPDSIVRKYMLTHYYGNNGSNVHSKINHYFGMQYQIQLYEDYPDISDDLIQVFFGRNIPFFLWIIAENREKLRVGVVAENAKNILDSFIKKRNIKGKIIDIIAGKISMGYIPTYYNNVALVGDAACQIKPLTGGGLSYGMQSAGILADCIHEGHIDKYDQRWKGKFGREIQFGLKARKIYENLDSKQRKNVFSLFRQNSFFIEQVVDFDNHSTLFKEAFKNPQFLLDAGKLVGYYIEDMLK